MSAEELSDTNDVEEEVTDLTNPDVVTKYKEAATIANKSILGLLSFCKPGAKVVLACEFGDTVIKKQCDMVFKSKDIEKGIAFPTCISINEVVCHYSPFNSEASDQVFNEGDLVKIDLGVYIDGYISVVAKSFVCSATIADSPITGRKADLFTAAYTALEGATKLMKPGASNKDITEFIKKVGECYNVTPVQGVLMHQLKRFVIDGNEVIINNEQPEQRVDEFKFEKSKVYTLDIVFSTGNGKPIQKEYRTTVFKRAIDQNYSLKMKSSRQLFGSIQKNCGMLPFTIRGLTKEEKVARLGITECIKHSLVHEYPVLVEKPVDGEKSLVVHVKATVLLMANGTVRITCSEGLETIKSSVKSEIQPTEEIKEILSRSAKYKKKKKNKKK